MNIVHVIFHIREENLASVVHDARPQATRPAGSINAFAVGSPLQLVKRVPAAHLLRHLCGIVFRTCSRLEVAPVICLTIVHLPSKTVLLRIVLFAGHGWGIERTIARLHTGSRR